MEPTAEVPPVTDQQPAETPVEEKPKKRKKDVPEWQRPEVLAEYDAETLKLINSLDGEIDSLNDDFLAKKEAAKVAKAAWEAKRDELQRLIKERKNGRGKPVQKTLFEAAAPVASEPTPVEPLAAIPVAEPSPLDSLWEQYPLDRCTVFGMTPRDIEVMAAGERKGGLPTYAVRTVGEMAKYTAGDGGIPRHIADFKGLGASGETRIGAALEGFWGWWNNGGLAEFAKEKGISSAVN